MVSHDQAPLQPRTIGRRRDDFQLEEKLSRHALLFHVGQIITSEIDMDALFPVIMEQTNLLIDTERSSVFVYDEKTDQLWSLVSTDLERNQIRFPANYGIAGWVFQNRKPLIVNDAYSDPRFNPDVDRKTGFHTRKILCLPLINRQKTCIGALQAINKRKGDFDADDVELLNPMSSYITIALENSKLYDDLKTMNKLKERVMNHLSHELKTPLAVMAANMERISRRLAEIQVTGLEKTLGIAQRNLKRLIRLQDEIDDILNEKSTEEKKHICKIIEDALSFIGYENGMETPKERKMLGKVFDFIESIYRAKEEGAETIVLDGFLDGICNDAITAMEGRDLEIKRDFERGVDVRSNKEALWKVFSGMLKNAVENTPDEGKIEISLKVNENQVAVCFRDYGVGITTENQKLIFSGFFHTQDTNLYSSKYPYKFNAGGSGADLLRAKVFSERYGFSIGFESTRCRHIPNDADSCPGRISQCAPIRGKMECILEGGSTFSVTIPRLPTVR